VVGFTNDLDDFQRCIGDLQLGMETQNACLIGSWLRGSIYVLGRVSPTCQTNRHDTSHSIWPRRDTLGQIVGVSWDRFLIGSIHLD